MRDALKKLRSILECHYKLEQSYRNRFNQAIQLCANVHEYDEKITLHVDGLSMIIETTVARRREDVLRSDLTFQYLVQYAGAEEDSFDARTNDAHQYISPTSTSTSSAWKCFEIIIKSNIIVEI